MKKILIVEDELLIAKVYSIHLENAGYKIVGVVSTISAALPFINSNSPDLILLDIQLKNNESGIELAKTIRTKNSCQIIFTTGNPLIKTASEIEGISNCKVMIKPVDIKELIKEIEE